MGPAESLSCRPPVWPLAEQEGPTFPGSPRPPCLCRAQVEEVVPVASGTAGGDDGGASGRLLTKVQPGHRSYNLQERRRIGSMTGAEQALLPRVPTDERWRTLATADLDPHEECVPGLGKPGAGGQGVGVRDRDL